ncbi:MAG TPA: DUF2188 domain-containing protein [Cytophagaceae bacterium]|jgi:hypothetical protein|nr:DUF2188 domain-containing protein [Cytophagaceae bacterium]
MPYTYNKFPASFIHLRLEERNKAIVIANTLIEEGYPDQMALSIAISNAKQWAYYYFNEGLGGKQNINVHLVPNPQGWALISEDVNTIIFICHAKTEALLKARSYAKTEKLKLFIHSEEGKIHDIESFVVNLPHKENREFDEEKLLIDRGRSNIGNKSFLPKRRHSQLIFSPMVAL